MRCWLPLLLLAIAPGARADEPRDARHLVERMVEECGGREVFFAKGDVQYVCVARDTAHHRLDVSLERALFDGERSWARYPVHEGQMPGAAGELIQCFDGKATWVTAGGRAVADSLALRRAQFRRRVNYYWVTMMFKLLDPGLTYAYEGTRRVGDIDYDLVRVGFEKGIGIVQDTYLLYLNPETHLVDQFLYTVMEYNRSEPILMKFEYEKIDGVLVPTRRMHTASNWAGEVGHTPWTGELLLDVRFRNGFTRQMFVQP